jgi:hypothetical protein
MKKIKIALLAIVVIISACSKEQTESSYQSINVSELSTTITEYVDENYPDASIVSALQASNTEATYLVQLNTNEELAFTSSGSYLGEAENYLQKNPQGRRGRHHHHHNPGHSHAGIPIDSLPTNVISYINSNFSSDTILGARYDSTCQFGKTIQVMVTHNGVAPTKLVFDLTGTYLYKAQRTLYASTPQAVKDTLFAVYNISGNKVRNKVEVMTLNNNVIEYNVFVRVNKSHLIVTIKDDGTIICTK